MLKRLWRTKDMEIYLTYFTHFSQMRENNVLHIIRRQVFFKFHHFISCVKKKKKKLRNSLKWKVLSCRIQSFFFLLVIVENIKV